MYKQIPEVVQPMTNDSTWSQFAGTNIAPAAVCHLADLGGGAVSGQEA